MTKTRYPVTESHVKVGDVEFTIIQMPTRVRKGIEIAASFDIVSGPGGSVDKDTEIVFQYYITVTHGGITFPLQNWEQGDFRDFITQATGVARHNIRTSHGNEEK